MPDFGNESLIYRKSKIIFLFLYNHKMAPTFHCKSLAQVFFHVLEFFSGLPTVQQGLVTTFPQTWTHRLVGSLHLIRTHSRQNICSLRCQYLGTNVEEVILMNKVE